MADPGILSYEMSDPLAAYGKSTPAHSTLNVNGWNQSGADAQLLRTEFTPSFALIHAKYEGGYWEGRYEWSFRNGRGRGVWGEHERVLLWVKGQYVLVLDTMATDPGQEVRNAWQMGATGAVVARPGRPGVVVGKPERERVAAPAGTAREDRDAVL